MPTRDTSPATRRIPVTRRIVDPIALRAPLFPAAAGVCTGIASERYLPLALGWYVALALAAGSAVALAVVYAWRSPAAGPIERQDRPLLAAMYGCIGLLAFSAGGSLFHAHFRRFEVDHLVHLVGQEPVFARLQGVIATTPVIVDPPSDAPPWQRARRTRVTLHVDHVLTSSGMTPASGYVSLAIPGDARLTFGDRVETYCRLSRVRPPMNPGQFRWDEHQRRQRVLLQAKVEHPSGVRVLVAAEQAADPVDALLAKFRRVASAALHDEMLPDGYTAGVLDAMVLGQRAALDQSIEQAFQRTGTTHLLAVSGFNMTLLAGVALFWARLATRSPRRQAASVMVVVVLYLLVAEPQAPLVRAGIMCLCVAAGALLSRGLALFNWLCGAALINLAVNPGDLFAAGFQLSYVSLLALLYIGPIVHHSVWGDLVAPVPPRLAARWSPARRIVHAGRSVLLLALSSSLAAATAGGAVAWFHFGAISPYAAINTVILTPIVSLMLSLAYLKWVISGAEFALVGIGLPADFSVLTALLAGAVTQLIPLMAGLVDVLALLPGSAIPAAAPSTATLAAFLVAMLVLGLHRRMERISRGSFALVALVYLGQLGVDATSVRVPPGEARLDLLSVGGGHASFLRSGREVLLYDAGSATSAELVERTLLPFCRHERIRQIDLAVVSHASASHYNAVTALAERVPIGRLAVTPQMWRTAEEESGGNTLAHFWQARRPLATTQLAAGQRVRFGDGELVVLWPLAGIDPYRVLAADVSMVVRFDHPGGRVLLCGEILDGAMQALLDLHRESSGDLHADVLVLPDSPRPGRVVLEFVNAVNPRYVLSSGAARSAVVAESWKSALAGRHVAHSGDVGSVRVNFSSYGVSVVRQIEP